MGKHTTLDTLVATEVMGWNPCHADGCSRYTDRYGVMVYNSVNPFSPSTNIAHAHMFRDKVLAENPGLRAVVTSQSINADKGMWFYVDVKDVTGRFISESGTHSTEPTALCLALLRALGVPEEKIKEAMDGK